MHYKTCGEDSWPMKKIYLGPDGQYTYLPSFYELAHTLCCQDF